MRTTLVAAGACLALAIGSAAQSTASASGFYKLESQLTIASKHAPNWDYLAFDAARSRLFIARREDGILVYDANSRKITGAIEQSDGGNATTLVPDLDRAFVVKEDGTLLTIELSTLKALSSAKVGDSADNAFYDATTGQLLITQGDDHQMVFVDARTGKVNGSLQIDSDELEGTVADGKGNYFMALRDKDKVLKIDARARRVIAEYTPQNCKQPNSLGFDAANQRVLLGCRGEKPVLVVMDTEGHSLSQTTIGRGIDVLVFDSLERRIYTANGVDGNLVILDQVDTDHYKLFEALTTRPYARTMALDPKTKKVYLVCAEGYVDPARPVKTAIAPFYPNAYTMNTFTLLTYVRQ